jgi:hypothetical protein
MRIAGAPRAWSSVKSHSFGVLSQAAGDAAVGGHDMANPSERLAFPLPQNATSEKPHLVSVKLFTKPG